MKTFMPQSRLGRRPNRRRRADPRFQNRPPVDIGDRKAVVFATSFVEQSNSQRFSDQLDRTALKTAMLVPTYLRQPVLTYLGACKKHLAGM